MALIRCPECQREVSSAAASCPGCGHPILVAAHSESRAATARWSPGIAAILSLVIPGTGQMYRGAIGQGILWLIFVATGYAMFIVPGLLLHLFCILNAASGSPNN